MPFTSRYYNYIIIIYSSLIVQVVTVSSLSKETLCMTVEIEAENEQQAEEKVRQAYRNEEYILDSEHFAGVEFTTKEKEMEERFRKQRRHEHER
ncbi:MAG: hypothetical protein GX213_14770 [Clostridiaceae bacterium]|nr:hypothetical protein [Clostridiaceae bacterium]